MVGEYITNSIASLMPNLIEITAIYRHERLRFENSDCDVVIADAKHVEGDKPDSINGRMRIKGPANVDQLQRGLTYRFYGRWSTYHNRRSGEQEEQFHFQSFVPAQPASQEGIVAYLVKASQEKGCGIGTARAQKLYQKFAGDAVRICREEPGVAAAAISGWRLDQATALAEVLEKRAHVEACSIELIELLNRRGFPKATATKAMKLWGNTAADLIRRNPYLLMSFRGCGFKRTDAMYLDLGLPPGRLKRQALCAWWSIASDSSGHTWYPAERVVRGVRASVAGCDLRIAAAMQLAKRAGILSFSRTDDGGRLVDADGELWAAETHHADQESSVARLLVAAEREGGAWPTSALDDISDHQQGRLPLALAGPIGILGGGPGTGKTYTAAVLIRELIGEFGEEDIAVAAPTGKAAVRITEALAQYNIPLQARTIHSLLKIDPSSASSGGWSFYYRTGRPLPFRFVIVDESSMIDTALMASLLSARSAGTNILFVGDVNQLPPVGHGAPLRDMIAADLPYGELREIRRNSGRIVQACAAIRDGEPWSGCDSIDVDAGENLIFAESSNPEQQKQAMLAAIEWAKQNGIDPVWGCQVLAAVNAKSELSRRELNKILQAELNPSEGVKGSPCKVGDKIVNTKNGTFPLVEKEQQPGGDDGPSPWEESDEPAAVYVANGDLAEVVEVAPKHLVAELSIGGKLIRIPRGKAQEDDQEKAADGDPDPNEGKAPNTGCSWDLAYCLSVHKSQGSEWPVVIVMLDEYPGAMRVASREWIYTGISRAKKLCFLVGKPETARRMCRRVALGDRKTLLRERINKLQVEELVNLL